MHRPYGIPGVVVSFGPQDKNFWNQQFWIKPDSFRPRAMPLRELPVPRGHEVHLWYLHLDRLAGALQHALGHERAGGKAPRLSASQLRFTRRFYLRVLLGAYLGIAGKDVHINRSNRGKPVLDATRHSSDLKFSMAKSENRVLIGVSATHLGVDLEPVTRKARNALRLARRYFSAREFAALERLAPDRMDEAFLRAWACNEAVVKASGLGIANQLCRFSVEMDPDLPPAMLASEDGDASEWSLVLVRPDEEFLAAVASRQARLEISAYQLLPAL